MAVRPILLSDADAVFRLLCEFAASYRLVRPAFDSSYPRLLGNEGTDLLVAEHGGLVVGYILASDSLTLFANGVVTELKERYV